MTDAYTFVLIHGAWHTGEHWAPIRAHLEAGGHTVHTPTIAGHGDGRAQTTHAEGVQSVLDYLDLHGLDDFILVGHSFAGTVLTKVAEAIPDRIRRLVFWNAFVLADGSSINDESPRSYGELMQATAVDGMFSMPLDLWRQAFIQDAEEDLVLRSHATLVPEPLTMLETRLDLTRFHQLIAEQRLRTSYLNATEDLAMPPGEHAWHPRFSDRLGAPRIVMMSGSHETMFSNPDHAAEKILEAGRD
ncbi:alpha/beta fold hydrolase [Microbacterium sp. Ag1]|uniref:alpha/beta fold hydrolase n=1 Tax=Microbacterium sp. Ag1 TaxID=1643443 RepID=UPI0006295B7C|nr:alpha/beta fold hydrolase [Microbacterium sp. Ag1]KKX96617.1 salicylate esterase [Microbacterium sp. Ag1]